MNSRLLRLVACVLRTALLAPAFLTLARATNSSPELIVNIRAVVEQKGTAKPTPEQLQKAKEHQRIYLLSQVHLIQAPFKLVAPVDEKALVAEMKKNLNKNGYEEAYVGGPAPEIVLYLYYGRTYLRNLYLGEATQNPTDGSSQGFTSEALTVSPTFKQLFNQHQPGYEEKLQRAESEKLVIYVLAFKFPHGEAKEKPELLWMTIMNIDAPDYRDLNTFAGEMFAAGGAYFGQSNGEKEAEVIKPLPEGHVTAGETKVIETDVPLPKK